MDNNDRCCVNGQFRANTDSGFVVIGFNGTGSNIPPKNLEDLVNPKFAVNAGRPHVATWGFVDSNILHVDEGLRVEKAMREAGDGQYDKYFLYDKDGPAKFKLHWTGVVEEIPH